MPIIDRIDLVTIEFYTKHKWNLCKQSEQQSIQIKRQITSETVFDQMFCAYKFTRKLRIYSTKKKEKCSGSTMTMRITNLWTAENKFKLNQCYENAIAVARIQCFEKETIENKFVRNCTCYRINAPTLERPRQLKGKF